LGEVYHLLGLFGSSIDRTHPASSGKPQLHDAIMDSGIGYGVYSQATPAMVPPAEVVP
jgi:hypothetical protein